MSPVDLGWLFLLPGIVLIAAAVLIAAEDDLHEARFRRDQAIAIEARHAERVERYETYYEAVQRRDPTVMRSLVTGQLNAEFTDRVEDRVPGVPVYDTTEVFASLEPPEAASVSRERVDSVLARWATDNSSRVWLLASGALCVFVGLLPPVNRRGGLSVVDEEENEAEAHDELDDTEAEDLAETDQSDDEPDGEPDDESDELDEATDDAEASANEHDDVAEDGTEPSDETDDDSDDDDEDDTDTESTAEADDELTDDEAETDEEEETDAANDSTLDDENEENDDEKSEDEVIVEAEDESDPRESLWQQPKR